jgi:hypothetical protein
MTGQNEQKTEEKILKCAFKPKMQISISGMPSLVEEMALDAIGFETLHLLHEKPELWITRFPKTFI